MDSRTSRAASVSFVLYKCSLTLWSRIFVGHQEAVNCVEFHPNANYLISGSDDRSIRLWDINSGKFERVFFMSNQGAYKTSVTCLSISPDGTKVAGGYDDGAIRIFDISSGSVQAEYFTKEPVEDIDYNSNGTLLCSISDKQIRVWGNKQEIIRLKPKLKSANVVSSCQFNKVSNINCISA